jgi:hypothetical protein
MPNLSVPLVERSAVVKSVQDYLDLMHRSLDTIASEKKVCDSDVAMLLSHVAALERGLLRMLDEVHGAEDQIEGLRARLKSGNG